MKRIVIIASYFVFSISTQGQGVAIGTNTPHSSAALDVSSTGKGLLVPRMTTNQRNAIETPAKGLLVFDNDTNSFWYYNGTSWLAITPPASGWSTAGNDGTTAANFIGTTDNKPLMFRTNGRLTAYLGADRNIFIGDSAGAAVAGKGGSNIGIGVAALRGNSAPAKIVAIGDSSMAYSKPGFVHITAVGSSSLKVNGGSYNAAFGSRTLEKNTTGDNNTALGSWALLSNSTGDFNTAAGSDALSLNTIGSFNTAIGTSSLYSTTSGNYNTALGYGTLRYNTTGSDNIAIGNSSLYKNTVGNLNISIGSDALANATTVTNAIAIGDSALHYNGLNRVSALQSQSNTAIGSRTLVYNNLGYGNTAVGYMALYDNVSGINNTAIGTNAKTTSGNFSNTTAIGAGAVVNASNKIRLGNGSVTVIEGQVAYTTSDGRFKKNLKENVPGLDFITSLKPYTYQYRSYEMDKFLNQQNQPGLLALKQSDYEEAESMTHMGFVAQEVEQLVKAKGLHLSLVHAPSNPTDNYSIAYGELVVPLVKAVQEQQAIIETQQQMIEQLAKRVKVLEAKN